MNTNSLEFAKGFPTRFQFGQIYNIYTFDNWNWKNSMK